MIQIKKLRVIILIILTFSFSLNANDLSPKVFELATKIEKKVIKWRHDFHQYPELSNREFNTSKKIAKHLKSLGLKVQTNVAKTGVVGLLVGGKPGPVIALRADMDALPVTELTKLPFASKVTTIYNQQEVGVMHACGHDAHVAILMGVAEILTEMQKDLNGSVKFIFQPAEEGAPKGEEGGAELMVKEGVLENPKVEVIFGLHTDAQLESGKISYHPGGTFAGISDMKITVKGKASHGASPWESVDPIVTSAQIINNLQTIVSRNINLTHNPVVVTIGSIHGGNRSNIIPDSVEMLGTVRTLSSSDEKKVHQRIRTIIENSAESMGAEVEIELPYSSHYPVTFNDIELTNKMLPSLEKSAGSNNVLLVPAVTIAEDFSFFSQQVPGLYFRLGGMLKGANPKATGPHHTSEFVLQDESFKTGVIALSHLVIDYMQMSDSD